MNTLSKKLQQGIELAIRRLGHPFFSIQYIQPISGGSINEAYAIQGRDLSFFVKINHRANFPLMFEKERNGLELLRKKGRIYIPKVYDIGHCEDHSFLIMEWIAAAKPKSSFWSDFGRNLAFQHQQTQEFFGFKEDNYVGSLPQLNTPRSGWVDFFIENRLQPQEKKASDAFLIDQSIRELLNGLYLKLANLFPEEPPALLHGDLWSGNFKSNNKGEATIFDPAVYYGHREMDLAMSLLFGGFHKQFYHAYEEIFPLSSDWEQRIDLCNLYPLLVHVNLFGASYAHRVKNILKQFA